MRMQTVGLFCAPDQLIAGTIDHTALLSHRALCQTKRKYGSANSGPRCGITQLPGASCSAKFPDRHRDIGASFSDRFSRRQRNYEGRDARFQRLFIGVARPAGQRRTARPLSFGGFRQSDCQLHAVSFDGKLAAFASVRFNTYRCLSPDSSSSDAGRWCIDSHVLHSMLITAAADYTWRGAASIVIAYRWPAAMIASKMGSWV